MLATGYYGIPGREGGKVHVSTPDGPICGIRVDPQAQFQWCANGYVRSYVECARCRRAADMDALREAEERVVRLRRNGPQS
jgi:hypothetical protein